MNNQEIFDKCKEKREELLKEINDIPRGCELWLYIKDNDIAWTTQTENTIPIIHIFSHWGHQEEKIDWDYLEENLWQDLYNSRGPN